MSDKKYILTNPACEIDGKLLYRIKAIKDFGDVKAGDLGGFIEKEDNLSHEGNAWVYDSAQVYGGAQVYDNVKVFNIAQVHGNAQIYDNACIYSNAQVCGNAEVYGNAQIYGNSQVYGDSRVYGDAQVCGNAQICGNAWVHGDSKVYEDARVYSNANILWISKIGSRFGTTTVFENKDGGISVNCGCFFGTLEEFEEQVKETHGRNKYGREYKVLIELIKIHFGLEKITDEK